MFFEQWILFTMTTWPALHNLIFFFKLFVLLGIITNSRITGFEILSVAKHEGRFKTEI